MKKTKYDSFLQGELPNGCKKCVKGQKMVLFVTGLCSRGCEFCPLSKKRKNIDNIYANERPIGEFSQIIEEVKISGAKGCSLTGGDPLLKLDRTISLAKKLKQKFGKKFHIHLYASTKLVNDKKLEKLSIYIDEIRFHPDLDSNLEEEANKIALAKKYWKKKNIGIELPSFPNKIDEIIKIVRMSLPYISFLNLNELESGEVSEEYMSKKYKLTREGYTIKNSIDSGKYLIKKINKFAPKLNIHLCTARLKNWHQYRNRLKNYQLPLFAKQTEEGTYIYFATDYKKSMEKILPKNKFILDKKKKRIILSPKIVLSMKDKFPIYKIEEYPTYEREEAEVELLE